ncbi:nitrogen assimilation transcription factor NirA [Penicillium sp. IBT 16267x]|nr:nitrogen assimilation transcription factor NirA [Penicillium sp. IBT 16267x]
MSPTHRSSPNGPQSRSNRACQFCRARKIRCDTVKPSCGSCQAHGRRCIYVIEPPKQRPSRALINEANRQKTVLENVLLALKNADPKERDGILNSVAIKNGCLNLANVQDPERWQPATSAAVASDEPLDTSSDDDDYDPTPFLSRDEWGALGAFGPSSTFHVGSPISQTESSDSKSRSEIDRHRLIANAALQRQKEYDLLRQPSIAGLPSDLAMHLLDLHWNRQHHTFLLTYRPAFMRDLVQGGPYCSDFLVNAVFACSSKFSERLEVRSDPARPETAGKLFFERCDQLLAEQSLLTHSSIPTVAGLLMLGSTFNARGQISKGWLYTGYALRMVHDLGLHFDCNGSAEDVEIRRRLFWGAFICDKLHSLYFGRPFTLQLRDAHVSRDFMDTFEENELWTPSLTRKSQMIIWRIHPLRHGSIQSPAKIIRRLMEANNIPPEPEPDINVLHTMDVNLDFQSFATLELPPGLADDETQYSIFPEFTQDLDLLFGFMNEPLTSPSTVLAKLNHASTQPT